MNEAFHGRKQIELDAWRVFQDGAVPEKTMKIGVEELPLDSWAKLCQYSSFKEMLGSGMNTHLKQNELLRDIFQMGLAPLLTVESKASRLERVSPKASILDPSWSGHL